MLILWLDSAALGAIHNPRCQPGGGGSLSTIVNKGRGRRDNWNDHVYNITYFKSSKDLNDLKNVNRQRALNVKRGGLLRLARTSFRVRLSLLWAYIYYETWNLFIKAIQFYISFYFSAKKIVGLKREQRMISIKLLTFKTKREGWVLAYVIVCQRRGRGQNR